MFIKSNLAYQEKILSYIFAYLNSQNRVYLGAKQDEGFYLLSQILFSSNLHFQAALNLFVIGKDFQYSKTLTVQCARTDSLNLNLYQYFITLTNVADINVIIQLSTGGQEMEGDDCGVPVAEPPPSLTPAEEVDVIMDHNIEVESNQRIRRENVNIWTLTFKQPEMEMKVCSRLVSS